jgi:hypothetical protein
MKRRWNMMKTKIIGRGRDHRAGEQHDPRGALSHHAQSAVSSWVRFLIEPPFQKGGTAGTPTQIDCPDVNWTLLPAGAAVKRVRLAGVFAAGLSARASSSSGDRKSFPIQPQPAPPTSIWAPSLSSGSVRITRAPSPSSRRAGHSESATPRRPHLPHQLGIGYRVRRRDIHRTADLRVGVQSEHVQVFPSRNNGGMTDTATPNRSDPSPRLPRRSPTWSGPSRMTVGPVPGWGSGTFGLWSATPVAR